MKLFISIVPRDISEEVAKVIGKGHIDFQMTVPGEGTATSLIRDYFSLEETDRDVIFSLVDAGDIAIIMHQLEERFAFAKRGNGTAFTIPVHAITKLGYRYLTERFEGGKADGK